MLEEHVAQDRVLLRALAPRKHGRAELAQTDLEAVRLDGEPEALDVDGEREEKAVERHGGRLGEGFDEAVEHELEDRDGLLDEDGEGFLGDGDPLLVVKEVADDGLEVLEEEGELVLAEVQAERVLDRVANLDRVGHCSQRIRIGAAQSKTQE